LHRVEGGLLDQWRHTVQDANCVTVAWLYCRDDSQRYSLGASKLTSEEARRIGKAISRIPEFMMPRQGFYIFR
jgi:hypothetical protein